MYQRRLLILTACLCVGFLLVGLRLAFLQVLHSEEYQGLADKQPLRERILPTARGRILDARGQVLAGCEPTYELCVRLDRLRKLPDAGQAEWMRQVARLVGRSPEEMSEAAVRLERDLEEQADRPGLTPTDQRNELRFLETRFEPLLTSLDFSAVARLESWRDLLPRPDKVGGDLLQVRVATRRTYPNGDTAAHIIGYLSRIGPGEAPELRQEQQRLAEAYLEIDPDRFRDAYLKCYLADESLGRQGLERTWEWALRGRRGLRRELVDARNHTIKVLFDYPPQPGADVYTTLDIDLQRVAEAALGEQRGAIVILDVATGAVLALASSPRFRLDQFTSEYQRLVAEDVLLRQEGVAFYQRPRPLVHRAIQETYPPGSIFKLVATLAGLRAGTLRSQTQYTCEGSLVVGGQHKQCLGFHGPLQLREAIERSCNVYFYHVALDAPRRELLQTARELGFGSPTGIDLPGEGAGRLPRLASDAEVANFAIGQGDVRVTPLQIAVMMAAIANGGAVVQPHLVESASPAEPRRFAIAAEDLETVRRGMRDVVQGAHGTARSYFHVTNVTVAAKTGTAEVEGLPLNHAWFAGFAPYEKPRIAFAVVVEWVGGHGAEVAAPVAEYVLSRLRFPPSPEEATAAEAPAPQEERHDP
jgi:penicillin-binding protein 2